MAERLVKRFGLKTLEMIEKQPRRLTEVQGIGKLRASQIQQAWKQQKGAREVLIFLQGHGIGLGQAIKIHREYGNRAVAMIRSDPYRLAEDIYGFGFQTADQIASRLGVLADAPIRAAAGLQHILRQAESQGHVYLPEDRLVLEIETLEDPNDDSIWALNEFTLQRQGDTGLLSIAVHVDGIFLNTYWADGLVVATPTGSTAYSLALGGPIMAPGCGSVLITPMAPHSLTVRPIVIPESSVVSLSMEDSSTPYIFTADGVAINLNGHEHPIKIKRAEHVVRLVQLRGQNIFAPLRNKLMWGK